MNPCGLKRLRFSTILQTRVNSVQKGDSKAAVLAAFVFPVPHYSNNATALIDYDGSIVDAQ